MADKRNGVIFACQSPVYHFIRQFSKKSDGYMLTLAILSSKNNLFSLCFALDFIVLLLIWTIKTSIYNRFRLFELNVKITLVHFSSRDKCVCEDDTC